MTYEETIQKYGLTGQTTKDQINQMYDSQLSSQKSQLQTNYETADAELAAKQAQARQALEKNISLTKTDAQKAAVSNAEYYNAAGLSSGARAQARLSQDNQLLANITALRAAQQQSDADIDRQRTLLSKEYAAQIQKAQADNDMARAEALYAEAKEAEEKLLAKQEAAASIMAQSGDYTRYGDLYGLTPDEIKKLSGSSSSDSGGGIDNQGYARETVKEVQDWLGLSGDGWWGPNSRARAAELGYNSIEEAIEAMEASNGWSMAQVERRNIINQLLNEHGGNKAIEFLQAVKPYLTDVEYFDLETLIRDRD